MGGEKVGFVLEEETNGILKLEFAYWQVFGIDLVSQMFLGQQGHIRVFS